MTKVTLEAKKSRGGCTRKRMGKAGVRYFKNGKMVKKSRCK